MSDFSDMLLKLRTKNNYTQKYVSEKLNISQRTYSGYETGTREPHIQMIIDISNFYNISIDVLLGKYKLNDKNNECDFTAIRSKRGRKPKNNNLINKNEIATFQSDKI